MMRLVLAAIAFGAIAAWPAAVWLQSRGDTGVAVAPGPRDYLDRDRMVAFFEREARRMPDDQITARMLAGQYLARFRERGDLGDVARAQAQAHRSLELQPYGNDAADLTMAAALLAYHEFANALHFARDAARAVPSNRAATAQIASLLMEEGRYAQADRTLGSASYGDANLMPVRARYDELTGKLVLARDLIDQGAARLDAQPEAPAYTRSWYHLRAAQLAFEAGDDGTVDAQLRESLRLFPEHAAALAFLARVRLARHDWSGALDAATRSADLYPLPQTLGYEADAQRALGDDAGAARTDAAIDAERKLYNVQGVNDRLLAAYYAERRVHERDAIAMARADLARRGDEIYADDTMAWVLGSFGRWGAARPFALRAMRLGTEDPLLQYHAGVIAMETGHCDEARRLFERALQLNSGFDAAGAEDARRRLNSLN